MAKFDYKIMLKKFGKSAIIVFLAGLASVYGSSNWYLSIAPLLVAAENYWKHK